MSAISLEELLARRDENLPEVSEFHERITHVPTPLRANKSADLDDLMDMLASLVTKAMKKQKVEFRPDEGSRPEVDQLSKIDHPIIFYTIVSFDTKDELKPRMRQRIRETVVNGDMPRMGAVWGQKFKATVQFNILACDYKTVTQVMKDFEKLIFSYTAHLKENGVAEIIFSKRLTDKNLDMYRQKTSVRSLQYYVEIEQLYVDFYSEVSDITISEIK